MDIDKIINLIRDFVEVEPIYRPESTHLLAYCLYCGEFPEHKETCPYRRAKEFLEEIEVPNNQVMKYNPIPIESVPGSFPSVDSFVRGMNGPATLKIGFDDLRREIVINGTIPDISTEQLLELLRQIDDSITGVHFVTKQTVDDDDGTYTHTFCVDLEY